MASPILKSLEDQVKQTTDVETAAATALNGVADRIDAAVKAALANGATADELAPVQTEVDALKASADSLAAAIPANTPAAAKKKP